MAPACSRSRLAGKVAGAVALSIDDILAEEAFGGGGPHGGYWSLGARGFVLHRVSDVTGVRVSGALSPEEGAGGALDMSGHISVLSRASGRLVLRGRILSGRVGRARVRARLRLI